MTFVNSQRIQALRWKGIRTPGRYLNDHLLSKFMLVQENAQMSARRRMKNLRLRATCEVVL
jgi:hypothetical protein